MKNLQVAKDLVEHMLDEIGQGYEGASLTLYEDLVEIKRLLNDPHGETDTGEVMEELDWKPS